MLVDARDRGATLQASDSRYGTFAKDKTSEGGKFIEVTLEVENLGDDMKSVTSQTFVDDKGREFTSSSETSEWAPEDKSMYILDNLNPNVRKTFIDIFEVPADARGLKVVVGDLEIFGGDKAQIELGF